MLVFKQLLTFLKRVVPLGLNEAGTFKFSSILIYYLTEQDFSTQMNGLMLELMKWN
jgi:hypothetical protein